MKTNKGHELSLACKIEEAFSMLLMRMLLPEMQRSYTRVIRFKFELVITGPDDFNLTCTKTGITDDNRTQTLGYLQIPIPKSNTEPEAFAAILVERLKQYLMQQTHLPWEHRACNVQEKTTRYNGWLIEKIDGV